MTCKVVILACFAPPSHYSLLIGYKPPVLIVFYRLDDESARADDSWGSQADLRATPRSASQPDLCVVGRGLYRD